MPPYGRITLPHDHEPAPGGSDDGLWDNIQSPRPTVTPVQRLHPDTLAEGRLIGALRDARNDLACYIDRRPGEVPADEQQIALRELDVDRLERQLREVQGRNEVRQRALADAQDEAAEMTVHVEQTLWEKELSQSDQQMIHESAKQMPFAFDDEAAAREACADLGEMTDAERNHWSALLAQEAVTEGRHHGPALINPHD